MQVENLRGAFGPVDDAPRFPQNGEDVDSGNLFQAAVSGGGGISMYVRRAHTAESAEDFGLHLEQRPRRQDRRTLDDVRQFPGHA
jgi:hypothetical protein